MTPLRTARARIAAGRKDARKRGDKTTGSLWTSLHTLAGAVAYELSHPLSSVVNGISLFAALVTGNGQAQRDAARRLIGWQASNQVAPLKAWVKRQLAALQQWAIREFNQFDQLLAITYNTLAKMIRAGLRSERKYRIRGDQAAEAYARARVGALHHLIEREAASAYRGGASGRVNLITRVADLVASRNPVVRGLVKLLVTGALDLLSVDNPLARIALGFIMRHVIDRLGVDRVAGAFVSDLLGPLLDDPRPTGLPGVVRDISGRLAALEGQQAQFYEHGGADILQAGSQWANITGPLADAAILGFLAQAALDPAGWAREVTDVVEPALTAAKDAFTALLREG